MTRRGDEDGDRELLRRCDEFTVEIDRACADRIEPIEGGFAALTPSLPRVWGLNYAMFEQPGMSAERMAELCERTLGGAGVSHLNLRTSDPVVDDRLEADFRRLGWEVDSDVFMVHRSSPDRPPPDVEVRRVPHPTDLQRALRLEDDFLTKEAERLDELVEQLLEMERRVDRAGGECWFVAEADGAPASAARLLSGGGVGQVEDVATLLSARNRGLARATVLAAVEASREEGNELTFIIADADDWPRKLYEKLGFTPVGTLRSFRTSAGSGDTAEDARA